MRKTAEFRGAHAEGRTQQLRRRIAVEAARLISEHGIRDYHMAKRKAAQRVGGNDAACLPRNREIESALREYQRLFRPTEQAAALHHRRQTARGAMHFLERFEPRLVGPVLEGTADVHSPLSLHVFDDSVEAVAMFLRDHGISFEVSTHTLRFDHKRIDAFPVLRFDAGGLTVEVTVFPRDALRQAPLDRVNDRPQQRASLAVLDAMLGADI